MSRGRTLLVLALTLACALSPVIEGDAQARSKKGEERPAPPPPRAPCRVVAIVPPRVEITRHRILGGVPEIEESTEAEQAIVRMLEAVLAERGYEVRAGRFAENILAEDMDLLFAVNDAQARFDEVWTRMVASENPMKEIREGRFDLGDPALLVAGSADVEGLVFVRGRGVSTGGGTKAAMFFMTLGGSVPGSGLSLYITLVDGRTGKVVDVSGGSGAGPILKKTNKVVGKALIPAVHGLIGPALPSVDPSNALSPSSPEASPEAP